MSTIDRHQLLNCMVNVNCVCYIFLKDTSTVPSLGSFILTLKLIITSTDKFKRTYCKICVLRLLLRIITGFSGMSMNEIIGDAKHI